jgi:hypothetical protein
MGTMKSKKSLSLNRFRLTAEEPTEAALTTLISFFEMIVEIHWKHKGLQIPQ